MSERLWNIALLAGVGVAIYLLSMPVPTARAEEVARAIEVARAAERIMAEERAREAARQEAIQISKLACRTRAAQACATAGGTLRDRCTEREIAVASYRCLDETIECCIAREVSVVEAPQPRERIVGLVEGAGFGGPTYEIVRAVGTETIW